MVDYSKKFRLDNKIAFVFGGVGLIGSEVSMALASVGAKTIILDVDEKRFKALSHGLSDRKFDVYFHNFDVTDINFLEVNLQELIDQYGTPDIFINCSYPRTSDWIKNTFSEASYNSYSNNIKIHLNSYVWLARNIAESMVSSSIPGSIIQLSSIYGIVGQDLGVYNRTGMKENMTYSVIKSGIIGFTKSNGILLWEV